VKAPRFVPGLAFRCLTPLYDGVLRALFDEKALKKRLLTLASVRPGERLVDVGCGTGTLLQLLVDSRSQCWAYGVDADPEMLARARPKLAQGRGDALLAAAFAQQLPFRPASFDRALSSLFFHHLASDAKVAALRAIHDVLRPGGTLHVLDFDSPATIAARVVFSFLRIFDGLDNTRDNARGLLPLRMKEAGFRDVVELDRANTLVGTLSYWRAVRDPGSPSLGAPCDGDPRPRGRAQILLDPPSRPDDRDCCSTGMTASCR
jgi:SAM-dependent methyltransferase